MQYIANKHSPNIVNVSIRHSVADEYSILSRAQEDVFCFVIYYKQKTDEQSKEQVGIRTRDLIDLSLSLSGSYYLPYQLHATKDQFQKAYPQHNKFLNIKNKYDPTHKFRNKLIDKYVQ